MKCFPFSTQLRGGKIAFRMSSCFGLLSIGGKVPALFEDPNVFLKTSLGSTPDVVCVDRNEEMCQIIQKRKEKGVA